MGYSVSSYLNPVNLWNSLSQVVVPKKETSSKISQAVCSACANKAMMQNIGSLFIKIAGLSGATAVAMGAYGSHGFYPKPDIPAELKDVYKTANYYHFLHTLALLAVPLTKRPLLVGSLLSIGMLGFCGTCYAYALTGNKSIVRFTPYGGTILIIAWLSMMI
ncbi:transmembrane protein 256 homolog [Stegodyphus dumicola]|uniref:transmembrane protein 256 homolog n=1 Tax=Stegodyphus dumicola TaxID=202533 RepID=UPI0015ABBA0F|nr:transmembrane protein 256 homolog [Stegodyphus dumicola]